MKKREMEGKRENVAHADNGNGDRKKETQRIPSFEEWEKIKTERRSW